MRDWHTWMYVLGGLIIGVTELHALLSKALGDTASEKTWAMPWYGRYPVALFCLWLTVHFAFKMFTLSGVFPKKEKKNPEA